MCVCIATAVDFSIQVQMNQWKIVWLPVWMNLMLLLEVVLSLVRVFNRVRFSSTFINLRLIEHLLQKTHTKKQLDFSMKIT